jgi:MOSC domain-containing protein YiiM
MDKQHEGLRKALTPEWRGGVACRVLRGGDVAVGDDVALLRAP